jgi:hypothetical protein
MYIFSRKDEFTESDLKTFKVSKFNHIIYNMYIVYVK